MFPYIEDMLQILLQFFLVSVEFQLTFSLHFKQLVKHVSLYNSYMFMLHT